MDSVELRSIKATDGGNDIQKCSNGNLEAPSYDTIAGIDNTAFEGVGLECIVLRTVKGKVFKFILVSSISCII